jgi:large subunit ribosomal protein L32
VLAAGSTPGGAIRGAKGLCLKEEIMQPSQKTGHARSRCRRSHQALKPVNFFDCPKCNHPKLPHAACDNCGYVRPGLSLSIEKQE